MRAQLVTNGSVSGAPCANSGISAGNAVGWSGCGFSPDLCCMAMPSYVATSSVTPVVSPDGGTWLGLAALGECAQTTITGLTIGNTYTLYFCGACFGTGTSIYNQGPAKPRITVGASAVVYTIPMTASTWYGCSMTFVATAATMPLRCDHPTGSVSYASLDGFSLSSSSPCALVFLPVELVSFGAEYNKRNKTTDIKWTTAIEKNVNYFTIQKSSDANHFIDLKTIFPKKNQGSSNKSYSITDNNDFDKGVMYYRLMTTDNDGSKSYSDLIDVEITDSKEDFKIYPNPTNDLATLSYYSGENEIWTVNIVDTKGKICESMQITANYFGNNRHQLKVSNLISGLYFVSLTSGNKIYKLSFIKE